LQGTAKTLLIRADANATIGTGHVMRCLALAQAWMERGGEATFAVRELPEPLLRRLDAEGVTCETLAAQPESEAPQLADMAIRLRASWVTVDLPHADGTYERCLKEAGLHLLLVDDGLKQETHCADVILNQNLGASASQYARREATTELLLGPQYILLRREFRAGRGQRREKRREKLRVLVSLGGSDPGNWSARILEGCERVRRERLDVMVVAGAANPHADELRSQAAKSGWRLRTDVTHMQELMAWADLAITAAGGTLWELLCMGCPVLSYWRHPVQAQVIADLSRRGVIRDMGSVETFDGERLAHAIEEVASAAAEQRVRMAQAGQQLVDGSGADRVCEALLKNKVSV
jgi:UDP-2,4-diacetamido-2,4,6-trideoxy-beta-L-altropyranose hydrolase